jgi:hypothetical protein
VWICGWPPSSLVYAAKAYSTFVLFHFSSNKIKNNKLKSQLKQKRKLFQDSEQEQLIDEMVELIPTVMKKLQKENLVVDFCQLLRLISMMVEGFHPF